MSTRGRLAGFVVLAAAAFALALGLGRAFGPTLEPAAAHDEMGGSHAGSHRGMDMAADAVLGGLLTSAHGYTLALASATAAAGDAVPLSFTITGPDGRPVTAYDERHDKRLHLIVVRRDLTGFQHVHPTLRHGVWSTRVALTPGSWRVLADVAPTGADPLVLGTDLAVPGAFAPVAAGPEARTAQVDGYTVTLAGDLRGGEDAALTLSVSRGVSGDGEPVTDLQPHLGAYGHLVALRVGDLAYLHVHPEGEPGDGTTPPGPDVVFHTTVPSAGRYRLFLDFRHRGVVHTAAFTVDAEASR